MSSLKTPKGSVWCYRRRIRHCEWPPRMMGFIHWRNVCQKEVITFSRLWEECKQEEARLKRRWEQLKIKLSRLKKYPSSDEEYKELNSWRTSYPFEHLDKKWWCYEWRRWWSLRSRRSLPTKQKKISIQLSFYDIVWLCICLYSVDMILHYRMFALMIVYY